MENMSLSDIAAVTKDNDDYFGNGGMWIFALLILMMMGGGYWNRGNQPEPVTEAGLCNAMNFNGLENSVGRLNDSLQNDYMGVQNGISNLGYETLRNFNETQNRISDCCCITQRGIDGVNYNGAINTANINANTTAQSIKAIGDTVTLGTSGIVRLYCGKNSSTLTVVISGQAVAGSNLAVDITKQ